MNQLSGAIQKFADVANQSGDNNVVVIKNLIRLISEIARNKSEQELKNNQITSKISNDPRIIVDPKELAEAVINGGNREFLQ